MALCRLCGRSRGGLWEGSACMLPRHRRHPCVLTASGMQGAVQHDGCSYYGEAPARLSDMYTPISTENLQQVLLS